MIYAIIGAAFGLAYGAVGFPARFREWLGYVGKVSGGHD